MRPKFLMALALGTVVIVTLMMFAKHQLSPPNVPAEIHSDPASPVASTETKAPMEPPLPPLAAPVDPQPAASVITSPAPVAELSDEERAAKIGEAIMQINAAIMQNDSNSVAVIMAGLTNAERAVREQSVSAVKQLGDRDLIPALTNLAARTENYEDRHALEAAADFIAQPTLAELEKYAKDNGIPLPSSPPRRQGSKGSQEAQGTRRGPQGQRQGNQPPPAPVNTGVPNQ